MPQVVLDQASFPCLAFAYAIVARTLVHAMSEEHAIHIVDLGFGDPNLWASIMQTFAHMGHGPYGPPHLTITCVNSNKAALEKLGTRLVKEAQGLDMPFQFNPLNVGLRELTIDMVKAKVRSGESLAFVSILGLHVLLAQDDRVEANFGFINNGVKDCKQMGQFLGMVKSMSPKVFLLVEQEADHNMNRLGERFIEGLHYYSAVFDALDGNYNYGCEERVGIEEIFGREIEDIVACEGLEREERHERYARWMVRFGGAGFKPVRLWCTDGDQQMVKANGVKDGYKIMNDKAAVMICWQERPLYAVSAWIC